jgi:hypothetical protein
VKFKVHLKSIGSIVPVPTNGIQLVRISGALFNQDKGSVFLHLSAAAKASKPSVISANKLRLVIFFRDELHRS